MSAAIVTGGSAGIGRAVVKELLEKGYQVISLDLQPSPDKHENLQHVKVDLADTAATKRVAEDIPRAHQVTTCFCKAACRR